MKNFSLMTYIGIAKWGFVLKSTPDNLKPGKMHKNPLCQNKDIYNYVKDK